MATKQNANYRAIGGPTGHLARCEDFRGHTMRAEHSADVVNGHQYYDVYSWTTLIARYDFDTGIRYIPDTYYSQTTTKQQNLCRAWMATAVD